MKRNNEQANNEEPPSAKKPKFAKPLSRKKSVPHKQTPTRGDEKILGSEKMDIFTPFTHRQHLFLSEMGNGFSNAPFFENVITVEGNIGCGKSTLLKGLEEIGVKVIQEPVDNIWHRFLPMLYEDPKRWGCTFQFEVFFWYQRLRDQILPEVLGKHSFVAIERSPHSSFHVFCKNLRNQKNVNDWEFDLLSRFFELTKWRPKKIIYLQAEPKKCVERIKKRNRKGEGDIDRGLIKDLHDLHEMFYASGDHDGCNVVTINANLDIDSVCKAALAHVKFDKTDESFDNIIG